MPVTSGGPPATLYPVFRRKRAASVVSLEMRDRVGPRIDRHRDTVTALVAPFDVPVVVVELDLADIDDAVHLRDVARVVDRRRWFDHDVGRRNAHRLGAGT